MYIIYKDGKFSVSNKKEYAVAQMEAPYYVEDGKTEYLFPEKSECGSYVYADTLDKAEICVEQKNENLFYIHRTWTNLSAQTRKIQTVFGIRPCFKVKKYLIPCVSINGNEFGNGLEPKGLERDGQKWIFSYDRVAIPACTVMENDEFAVSLFASDEDADSLVSSCSIWKDKETEEMVQEIYHPVVEAPITYCTRDGYAEGYDSFIELGAGESFSCGMYLVVSKPKWENYGICHTLDQALEIFGNNQEIKTSEETSVWKNSITFAKSLIREYKGKKGFHIGWIINKQGGFSYRGDHTYELAWCGQNVLLSRMLVEDYIRFGNQDSLDTALEILDTRVECAIAENGLLASQLKHFEFLKEATADTCNMGYGAYEFLRCYKRLKEIGIDRPAYLQAARGCCDFFCEHYSEEYGFGKQWRLDGTCLEKEGAIGAFIIPAMAELYKQIGEPKYLDMAEKAMEFYTKRDIDNFCCTAGALDTSCVDKETSAPFIMSAVLLYELTGKEIYLEYGKKAAYYFTSWMFHYQPVYGADTEIAQYNICIKGLTSVSTQHHHLDMYAGIVVPYMYKLAEYTGDVKFRTRGEMMWRAVLQGIGDGEFTIHDRLRPIGSQNEAIYHCRWVFVNAHEQGKRGSLNDWLVAWPCAFRLSVLAEHMK